MSAEANSKSSSNSQQQEAKVTIQAPQAIVHSAGDSTASKVTPAPYQRPIWLPEKFKNEEALAKAYLDLEKDHSRLKGVANNGQVKEAAKDAGPTAGDKPASGDSKKLPSDSATSEDGGDTGGGVSEAAATDRSADAPASEDKALAPKEALEAKGLNMAKYEDEFLAKQSLSKESRAELNAAGFSNQMVDQYIAGAKAQEENLLQAVGISRTEINNLVAWTAEGLTAAEQAAYTKLVESKDVEQIKMGLSYAKSKFDAANGKAPKLVQGQSAPIERGYESGEQVRTDMRDPRYSKDPAYRDMVDAKLRRSNLKKINR